MKGLQLHLLWDSAGLLGVDHDELAARRLVWSALVGRRVVRQSSSVGDTDILNHGAAKIVMVRADPSGGVVGWWRRSEIGNIVAI